jgi:hypothetical protein
MKIDGRHPAVFQRVSRADLRPIVLKQTLQHQPPETAMFHDAVMSLEVRRFVSGEVNRLLTAKAGSLHSRANDSFV